MKCLRCGTCCVNSSPYIPFSEPSCPNVVRVAPGVYSCSSFEDRPDGCRISEMEDTSTYKYCPVGMRALRYPSKERLEYRLILVDEGLSF